MKSPFEKVAGSLLALLLFALQPLLRRVVSRRVLYISQKESAPRRKRVAGLLALLLLLVVPLPQFAPFTLTGCAAPTGSPTPSASPSATNTPTAGPSVTSGFEWNVLRVDGVVVRSDPAVIDEYGFTPDGLCQGTIPDCGSCTRR